MTTDVQTLPAGREMDALVAEKVMGWRWVKLDAEQFPDGHPWAGQRMLNPPRPAHRYFVPADGSEPLHYDVSHIPAYSTDIAAAVQVVERMRDVLPVGRKTLRLVSYEYGRTYATFNSDPSADDYAEGNGEHALPLAICRAALAALEAA